MKNLDDTINKYLCSLEEDDCLDEIFLYRNKENKEQLVIESVNKALDTVENIKESLNKNQLLTDEMKLKIRIAKNNEINAIKSLIKVIDSTEWMMKSCELFDDDKYIKIFDTTRKLIKRELENRKIIQTPNIGDIFNSTYHMCSGYKNDSTMSDNQICDVIEYGYIYKGEALRLANVIVVKN